MTEKLALIYLHVHPSIRGRWVRASRRAGMKLTDWVVHMTQAAMATSTLQITVPDHLRFADLKLARESDGDLTFDAEPLELVAQASGPKVAELLATEEGISTVVSSWYHLARTRGEPADATAADLIAETLDEEHREWQESRYPVDVDIE